MVRIISIINLVFFLWACSAFAFGPGVMQMGGPAVTAASTDYCDDFSSALFCEDFESDESCSTLGFDVVTNSPSCQEKTIKIDDVGSALVHSGSQPELRKDFTASSTVFVKGNFYATDVSGYNYFVILHINGTSTIVGKIGIFAAKLAAYQGTKAVTSTSSVSANTWYTYKMKYVAENGTDGDGQMYLWFESGYNQDLSTDTADAECTITDGDNANSAGRLTLLNDENGDTVYFDNTTVTTSDPDA